MRITKDRLALTKRFIVDYNALERKNCMLVEWIALKFSCSPREAERLIERVRSDRLPETGQ